jgi:nucleoside-diphosphate-sugar epimerase
MKILFIGGTGNISAASVRLAVTQGHDVYLLNRGQRSLADFDITGAKSLVGDIHDESSARDALGDHTFDVVANFIAFKPTDIERDVRLFTGRCAQYIFISSASVYQKPLAQPFVTESTPLKNPYWGYSRDKIACENACLAAYRESNFPITIVRPSLTY